LKNRTLFGALLLLFVMATMISNVYAGWFYCKAIIYYAGVSDKYSIFNTSVAVYVAMRQAEIVNACIVFEMADGIFDINVYNLLHTYILEYGNLTWILKNDPVLVPTRQPHGGNATVYITVFANGLKQTFSTSKIKLF